MCLEFQHFPQLSLRLAGSFSDIFSDRFSHGPYIKHLFYEQFDFEQYSEDEKHVSTYITMSLATI